MIINQFSHVTGEQWNNKKWNLKKKILSKRSSKCNLWNSDDFLDEDYRPA